MMSTVTRALGNSFMATTFKQLTDFLVAMGADKVEHTETIYLAHAIGVHNDLRSWGCDEDVCRGGMFHSIYGTELFQRFTLPLEQRPDVRELIGDRAERLAYWNCAMDRETFDAAVSRAGPPFQIRDRLTGEQIELSESDFNDLVTIHLCDWLEQVERSKMWDYRVNAYRVMADYLGGVALENHQQVFGTRGTAPCEANG